MTDKTKDKVLRSRNEAFEAYKKATGSVKGSVKGIGHSQEHDCAMLGATLLIVEVLFDIRAALITTERRSSGGKYDG